MHIQFVHPWLLYFLWVAPAVGAWWFAASRRREAALAAFMSPAMQAKLRPAHSAVRSGWQAALLLTGLVLALVAAARPQWGQREETVYQRGRDVVIALDVSRSMLATDVHPNRLERAKIDLVDLIKELQGDRAALLAFRRTAVLLCPLTTDYAYLRQSLDGVGPWSAPRGETDVGDAILKAMEAFENEGSHKAIVLISDGDDLSGRALAAAEQAAKKSIPIFTVGLGSRAGARVPAEGDRRGYTQYRGEDVVSKLNNDTLLAIARATQGVYIPVETASTTSTTLGMLYRDHLRNLTAQDIQESTQQRYVERYQIFLLPAVLLFLASFFLSRGRLALGSAAPSGAATRGEGSPPGVKDLTPPRQALRNIALVLAAGLAASAARGQTNTPPGAGTNAVGTGSAATRAPASDSEVPAGRAGARLAQRLYGQGQYAEAAEAYQAAARGVSAAARRDFKFNAAAALFRAGKQQEAADVLREIMPQDKAREAINSLALGTALYRAAEHPPADEPEAAKAETRARLMREAGEAFRGAARLAREEDTARRNLAISILALREADEQAKIARLTEEHKATPPPALAEQMLQAQRGLNADALAAFNSTNPLPERLAALEALSTQQRETADLWIPLKSKLLEAAAQQGQKADPQALAGLTRHIEATRDYMHATGNQMRDLDPEAVRSGAAAEGATYLLWKGIAPYGPLLREDLRRQTNSILLNAILSAAHATNDLPRLVEEQSEALSLTGLFLDRFTNAVPPEGTQPPSTNAPAAGAAPASGSTNQMITAETRQKIVKLAAQAITAQTNAASLLREPALPEAAAQQNEAQRLLREIEKLLPKAASQSQSQQQKKQERKEEEQKQSEPKQQQSQEQQAPQPGQQEQPKPQEAQEKKGSADDKKEKLDAEQLRRLLEKALQREREHEEEKRQLQERIAPSSIDRDW